MISESSNVPQVRQYLFWDVDTSAMDWHAASTAAWLLERIAERGGHQGDFDALVDFYGLPLLQKIGREIKDLRFAQTRETLAQLLSLAPSEMKCYTKTQSRAKRLLSLVR